MLSIATLYVHINSSRTPLYRGYVWLFFCVYSFVVLTDIGRAACLNIKFRRSGVPALRVLDSYYSTKQQLIHFEGAHLLRIRLHRRISFAPGQYVYIRFLRLGLRNGLQSHPFWVIRQDYELDSQTPYIEVLVKIRYGLTRRLGLYKDTDQPVWLSGPYGRSFDHERYGTILMFATDIGVTAHLSYLSAVLRSKAAATSKTKKAILVWKMHNLSKHSL